MSDFDIFASLQSSDQEIVEIIAVPFLESVRRDRDCLVQASTNSDCKALEMVAHSLNRLLKYRPANADGGMERSRFS